MSEYLREQKMREYIDERTSPGCVLPLFVMAAIILLIIQLSWMEMRIADAERRAGIEPPQHPLCPVLCYEKPE